MSLLGELLKSEDRDHAPAISAIPAIQGGENSKNSRNSNGASVENEVRNSRHTAAISAIPAIPKAEPAPRRAANSRNSKNSKGTDGKSEVGARLLALAKLEHYDEQLVHKLTAADLADCIGERDRVLVAYLQALEDTARREAGRVPLGHNGAILCRRCGPVFVSPDVARVLPVISGWPTAIGCPWCHVSNRQFPRPPVQSVTCTHWQPGEGSSYAGGNCKCGHHYPNELHCCDRYAPEDSQ